VKPAKFDYYAAKDTNEALDLLARHGPEAKILAGGQSLMPLLNMRLARPKALIDLNSVDELKYIRKEDGRIAIGSMISETEVEDSPLVRESCPILADAVKLIGHPAIRNRGTIGGSIAHADPAAEIPAVLNALGGEVRIRSAEEDRFVAPEDFFVTFLTTALKPNEIVTEISFPVLSAGMGWAVEELMRRHGDFAIVGAAVVLTMRQETIDDVKIVLFGAGDVAFRAKAVEQLLKGAQPESDLLQEAALTLGSSIDPPSDVHASARYRREVAGVLMTRALQKALARANRKN
jgi:CO/xanthine dehydrogenase FAD-binding subunit